MKFEDTQNFFAKQKLKLLYNTYPRLSRRERNKNEKGDVYRK